MKAGDGIWQRPPGSVPGLLDQNQQDYTAQVGKALSIQGSVPGHVDPRLSTGIQVDDFTRPEFAYLRRLTLAYFGSNVPAGGAGLFGFSSIRGGSGKIVVVEKVLIGNPTAATIVFSCGVQGAFPSGVGAVAGTARDTRFGVGTLNTLAVVRGGTDAAPVAPSLPFQVAVPAGATYCLEPQIVLVGVGSFFSIIAGTANVAISAAWFWRERAQLHTET